MALPTASLTLPFTFSAVPFIWSLFIANRQFGYVPEFSSEDNGAKSDLDESDTGDKKNLLKWHYNPYQWRHWEGVVN